MKNVEHVAEGTILGLGLDTILQCETLSSRFEESGLLEPAGVVSKQLASRALQLMAVTVSAGLHHVAYHTISPPRQAPLTCRDADLE